MTVVHRTSSILALIAAVSSDRLILAYLSIFSKTDIAILNIASSGMDIFIVNQVQEPVLWVRMAAILEEGDELCAMVAGMLGFNNVNSVGGCINSQQLIAYLWVITETYLGALPTVGPSSQAR